MAPRLARRSTTAATAFALLLASGAVYERLGAASDARRLSRPGQLIDIGGTTLHARIAGSGAPIVILEAGAFGSAAAWSWIQQDLSMLTTTVSYDRAGHGWSGPASGPRDADAIAGELHALLQRLGVPGPYVLVGHSLGGLYVRAYQARHPDRVAALVLVDASHPRQGTAPGIGPQMTAVARFLRAAPTLARLGLVRLVSPFASQADGLPAPARDEVLSHLAVASELDATRAELLAWPRTTDAASRLDDLGHLPVTVITAGRSTRAWRDLQADLTHLSDDSTHVTVAGATHMNLLTQRADARVVSAAIGRAVERLRGHATVPTP